VHKSGFAGASWLFGTITWRVAARVNGPAAAMQQLESRGLLIRQNLREAGPQARGHPANLNLRVNYESERIRRNYMERFT
jgi:hypothetical protein